jgi:hypothetical protein
MPSSSDTQSSSNQATPGETTPKSEDDDSDLKILNARRMLELRKRMNSSLAAQQRAEAEKKAPPPKRPPSDREIVLGALADRGDEVFAAAEASYPNEMKVLTPKLADLIREGKITRITGGDLLQFFRAIGMRVSVKTSISVQEHGKFVDLAEKFKRMKDEY